MELGGVEITTVIPPDAAGRATAKPGGNGKGTEGRIGYTAPLTKEGRVYRCPGPQLGSAWQPHRVSLC